MIKETTLSRSIRLICAAGAASLIAAPALAQQADQPMQRVQITGSAIKRIDAETAVPVTVVKMDDLKAEGITTVEQVLSTVAAMQPTQTTSQVVGSGTGGASFADMRGIGANKTLVLLNGRRLANNAFDSSAPDLNMIPFAAIERVEVLRDGASSLYGSDAVGGVINFITKKDFTGGIVTVGGDSPQHPGGQSVNTNVGYGYGDVEKDGFNFFAMADFQKQRAVGGLDRPFNKRYAGGLSGSTSPANYYQEGDSGNPAAPNCTSAPNLVPDGTSCKMTTSSFVDYIPRSERATGLFKGTLKLPNDHQLGLEYLVSRSKVESAIAPVPYGGLIMNRTSPYYPGNPGAITPNIPLDPNFLGESGLPDGAQPGYINVMWRDLPNGSRADENINRQQRFVASLSGNIAGWDYQTALSYNENKVKVNLYGYSDGDMITKGVLDGVINPFGDQTTAGMDLLMAAALNGNIQNAKGTTKTFDFNASRELGDWAGAGRNAALAIGGLASREKFLSESNTPYAEKVVASTGIDPNAHDEGSRSVYAAYAELNVPLLKTLDVTAAVRYDKYSDFGNSTNPKVSFRWQPVKEVLVRGSYSTGFRAPSLYEINSAQAYTNTSTQNDPINCPDGVPIPGKGSATNCRVQFQKLQGGNKNLAPEESKNATFGVVYEGVRNLTLSADVWAIQLDHQIDSLSEDDVFADPIKYASLYHRNAAGNLSIDGSQCVTPTNCGYVDLRTQNLGSIKTNGVDLGAQYRLRTTDFGTYNLSLNSTWVHSYKYQTSEGGEWIQKVGAYRGTGPIFRWQNTANLRWNLREFGAGLTANYKSGYLDADNAFDNNHRVASYTTFDGYLSWAQKKGYAVTFGVRNLFDREPPLSFQEDTFQAGYDPRYTNVLGRTYYLRASYSF
ncbi:iron complex outermembrane receptor protein [Pseudoduganella flava]|uniref:Iron complex outermembrane receptor protein n=1 Tax=Pseudoduganella flava TaxID=871742 RepID=A0A562Q3T8_9BURK|nr:TonB-dependent receptor [Pseudoduganella flava]QGZ41464.1 TonB-dependent receptor [Pseudoduganella flava]TWI51421.1 iron complex outermembrane receptor protein [Pseudoduganella flava]